MTSQQQPDEPLTTGRLAHARSVLERARRAANERSDQRRDDRWDLVTEDSPGEVANTGPDLTVTLGLAGEAGCTVHDIDSALERVADGTYGRCADCQQSIEAARLMALPMAHRCLGCQQQYEDASRRVT